MNFEHLILRGAWCFGFCPPGKGRSWVDEADLSVTKGWKNVDVGRIDEDFRINVDASYFFVAQGIFDDLDSGIVWKAIFVNDHALWKLEIENGRDAETLPEDAKGFFASKYFKKFSKRCGDLIDRAVKVYRQTVEPHLQEGELMGVDPVKLERIVAAVTKSKKFMENLRTGMYELQ